MAARTAPNGPAEPNRGGRYNALAEIRYASITNDSDYATTPSEDESPGESYTNGKEYPTEDADTVLGVSISRAQTRLKAPETPAAEKAAAMEDIHGGGLFDEKEWIPAGTGDAVNAAQQTTDPSSSGLIDSSDESSYLQYGYLDGQAPERPQLQHTSAPASDKIRRSDSRRASLRESLNKHRRSMSTDARKYLPSFSTPKSPTTPSLTSSSSGTGSREQSFGSKGSTTLFSRFSAREDDEQDEKLRAERAARRHSLKPSFSIEELRPNAQVTTVIPGEPVSQDPTSPEDDSKSLKPPLSRKTTLRRSASNESFLVVKNLSRVSSLGDDSRFENVQEQINSRFKAIKDTLQDSNFRMPNLPSMPTFNFSRTGTDLGHLKTDSLASKLHILPRAATESNSNIDSDPKEAQTNKKRGSVKLNQAFANGGMTAANSASHPFFTKALEELEGDVVVLGGYRGSILRAAQPPNQRLWVPIKVGLNIRKVNLEVGLNPQDEEDMEKTIIPDGMLSHIGPVDISRRLFKRLRASENAQSGKLRVHDYGYDWRLSPHLLARKFIKFLESLPSNKPGTSPKKRGAIVIAHSLGGLITRHCVNQRPELFAGVVYAGVPQNCVNILGPFRNGDEVLLSSRVLTAQVNFTIRTSFALLPVDGKCFIDKNTKEEYPVDFFNPEDWVKYGFSPCITPPLPPLNQAPHTGITGMIGSMAGSMASVMPSLPLIGRRGSQSRSSEKGTTADVTSPVSSPPKSPAKEVSAKAKSAAQNAGVGGQTSVMPQMGQNSAQNPQQYGQSTNTSVSTAVTIPREAALEYLTRTLAETKRFKQELAFNPSHAESNAYPPVAVIYGKSEPTVYGAKVVGRDGIKRADAYDELAFASGDGVVLARAAMVPHGYAVVRGGVVSSDRGHISLLGDLEAVGRTLGAVMAGREAGIGLGVKQRRRRREASDAATTQG
ncbi:hypothetical protein K402DRAFT_393794 [Aulographum hederae CBS 113979]|uniref:Alpha/beta-hydrolase n=1 Tax=Aulographum hederae CBS 113979 TaxID=1176131 RepID=A0A6G1GZY1_9PEZI|nr:hypothetical protein K402DRAFT_393794 [Aulographum hederae CBS 113979]